MSLLAFVRGVFGIFHLIAEFKEGIFDIVEAIWGGLAGSRAADRRHVGAFGELCFQINRRGRIEVSRECKMRPGKRQQQLVVNIISNLQILAAVLLIADGNFVFFFS